MDEVAGSEGQQTLDGLAETADAGQLQAIAIWADVTDTGDRADLPIQPTPAIGGVGLLDDAGKAVTLAIAEEGQALILIGDTMPPGAMRAMQRPGPVSSMNWAINLLDPLAQTRDGWWLAEAASDHADHGYSSERLRLWDADGRLVMIGQQAAAVFG